jgi:hypothetical protein
LVLVEFSINCPRFIDQALVHRLNYGEAFARTILQIGSRILAIQVMEKFLRADAQVEVSYWSYRWLSETLSCPKTTAKVLLTNKASAAMESKSKRERFINGLQDVK